MYTLVNEEKYSDDQVIFREDSSGDWIYVIVSGKVEVSRIINNKKYVLEMLKKGDIFGEMAFLGNTKRTASATSVGDTVIGIIDRESMDKEFNKLSSGFRAILVTLVTRFKSMNERVSGFSSRIEPRVPKALSLSYKDKSSFLKAYSTNISKGGLFIKTSDPLPQGTLINLRLQLPDLKEFLKIESLIAWINKKEKPPAGMGLQFINMSENDNKLLQAYIKALSGV